MARRRRNPREIPAWAIQVAVLGVGAFLLYKIGRGFFDKAKDVLDKPSQALANAIVGKSQMKIADGLTYILPTGVTVAANKTISLGGPYFEHTGVRYKITEAAPPGSGFYKAVRA